MHTLFIAAIELIALLLHCSLLLVWFPISLRLGVRHVVPRTTHEHLAEHGPECLAEFRPVVTITEYTYARTSQCHQCENP